MSPVRSRWRRTPRPEATLSAPEADVAAFLVRLGKALHTYGSPSHRTEEALVRLSGRFGVRGQFLVTPTSVIASFGEDEAQITRLARVDAGETDLQKLARLHEVMRDVHAGTLTPAEGRGLVEAIVDSEPSYGRLLTWLAFTATSAAGARFFGGGLVELVTATAAGALVGLLSIAGAGSPRVSRLLPATAGVIAASAAGVGAATHGAVAAVIVLASLIVLLPGLTLTVAMNELALGHVVSGSARLTGATITFLQLGFGVAIGTQIATRVVPTTTPLTVPDTGPWWTLLVALVVASLSLMVLFRARGRDVPVILVMSALAFGSARLGTTIFGPELGAGMGALVLGVASNLASRWLDQPSAIALIPALILLVPGSLGFRSLQALLADDVVGGIESLFSMALVAIALVSGLLVANLLMTPRRLL